VDLHIKKGCGLVVPTYKHTSVISVGNNRADHENICQGVRGKLQWNPER